MSKSGEGNKYLEKEGSTLNDQWLPFMLNFLYLNLLNTNFRVAEARMFATIRWVQSGGQA